MTAYTEELVNSLTTLNKIAETLNRSTDVASALNSALADLVNLMGLETGWVFLQDPAAKSQWFGRGFTLAADYNLPPAMARNKAGAWKGGCDCQALCSKGTLTGAYNEVRCSRLAATKGEERGGLVVHASAPLRSGEHVLGILNVAAPDWESFTPEALALLTNAGSLMGIALERARLYDLLREQRIDEQAALLEFSNQLLIRSQPRDLLDYMVREVRRLLHVDAVALVAPGDSGAALTFKAAAGWHNDPVALGVTILDSEFNVIGQTMRSQQRFLAEDIEAHVIPLYELEWLQGEGFRGYAVVPLLIEGHAIGALMLNTRQPHLLSDDELRFLRLMANQAAIAVDGLRLRQEEVQRQRMQEELAVGRQIQLSMLPKACPIIPGWQIVAVYQAARMVGGDFYDFFELPGPSRRVGMLVADVADKGVPAALFMALSRTVIRTTALSGRGAAAALLRANQLILNDSQSDLFLSAFYAILEPETGRLLYANAGHNRPLWYRAATDTVQELRARGIILGVFEGITIEERRIVVEPGDVLLFYTDGIPEALNAEERMMGMQRLVDVLKRNAQRSAQAISNAIVDAYNEFTGPTEQSDDVTFFVVKRTDDRVTR
jgi:sigma-B regulation protein RsbU (phosphoserine phosphatase)